LWLDKACIDQSDITESLLCLPVYLSYCQKLLVLAGPTYSSRLWCVLELYCFVIVRQYEHLHNSLFSRLAIRPFDASGPSNSPRALLIKFEKFDAAKAACFVEEDRHHLLAVIESGYGSLNSFNHKLRGIVASVSEQANTGGGDGKSDRLSACCLYKPHRAWERRGCTRGGDALSAVAALWPGQGLACTRSTGVALPPLWRRRAHWIPGGGGRRWG